MISRFLLEEEIERMEEVAEPILGRRGITIQSLRAADNRPEMVDARREIATELFKEFSTPKIGRFIHRDHTTILNLLGRIEEKKRPVREVVTIPILSARRVATLLALAQPILDELGPLYEPDSKSKLKDSIFDALRSKGSHGKSAVVRHRIASLFARAGVPRVECAAFFDRAYGWTLPFYREARTRLVVDELNIDDVIEQVRTTNKASFSTECSRLLADEIDYLRRAVQRLNSENADLRNRLATRPKIAA